MGDEYIDVGQPRYRDPLPDDFTLQELLRLDLTSPEAIRALIAEVGALTGQGIADGLEYLPTRERRHRRPAETRSDGLESVEDMRDYLRAARAMSRHLLAHLAGTEAGIREAWPLEGFAAPRSTDMAWDWWQEYMNVALAPFRMYVEVDGPDGVTSGWSLRPPTLYSACALQLAAYLATNASIFTCLNDRCRKPFTRQRTSTSRRRNADQFHTSGVLYCSRECLKRKSERDRYRRRKAEADR